MLVSFSRKELTCLEDTNFLIVKNTVSSKLQKLLKSCSTEIKVFLESDFPEIYTKYGHLSPKVSRGENYKGLPYFVLDYPRYFQHEATFSYRIICLWGNYFTFNLYLTGNAIADTHFNNWDKNVSNYYDCFIGISDNPWTHYIESPDYIRASEISASEIKSLIFKNGFLKISKKTTFKTWSQLPILAQENLKSFIEISGFTQQV